MMYMIITGEPMPHNESWVKGLQRLLEFGLKEGGLLPSTETGMGEAGEKNEEICFAQVILERPVPRAYGRAV